MAKLENPWLGLASYEEKDEYRFKGREKDTENMLTMLRQNDCVVCYAGSGDGKSSLINAGLSPVMRREGMFPLRIIFTTEEYEGHNLPLKTNGTIDFDQLIINKVNKEIEKYKQSFVEIHGISEEFNIKFEEVERYKGLNTGNSLWWKFRTQTIQMSFGEYDYVPVLIFDQFEEIFRSTWKSDFFYWLETLMKDIIPIDAQNVSKKGDCAIPDKKLFKLLFSMRYEYVGELDYWCSQRTFIPQISKNRYFLKPLTRNQSIQVILNQTQDDAVSMKLKDNAEVIVDSIMASSTLSRKDNDADEVPAIVLSLVCYVLYDEWSYNEFFSLSDMGLNEIIYDFYRNQLEELKITDEHRRVLEHVLISQQKTRLRIAVSDSRLQEINIQQYLHPTDDLVSRHILKKENSNNEDYIELIHDRLVEAIFKHREEERIEQLEKNRLLVRKRIYSGVFSCLLIVLFCMFSKYILTPESDDDKSKNSVTPNELEITMEDLRNENYKQLDYANATSLKFSSDVDTCKNKINCYENVLSVYSRTDEYAQNAERLVFIKQVYFLILGKNVKEVILMEPDYTISIEKANPLTKIYVPYGYYDILMKKDVFKNVPIQELSLVETFWEKLKYDIQSIHVHLGCCIPMWIIELILYTIMGLFVFRTKIPYVNSHIFVNYSTNTFVQFLVLSLFYKLVYHVLIWKYNIPYQPGVMPLLSYFTIWLFNVVFKKKERKTKIPYCIIFNTLDGKSKAIELKKTLIDNGLKDSDIRLDLSILKRETLDMELIKAHIIASRHIIFIFSNSEPFGFDKKEFLLLWPIGPVWKRMIHPIVYGVNPNEEFKIPKKLNYLESFGWGCKGVCCKKIIVETKLSKDQINILLFDLARKLPTNFKSSFLYIMKLELIIISIGIIIILLLTELF